MPFGAVIPRHEQRVPVRFCHLGGRVYNKQMRKHDLDICGPQTALYLHESLKDCKLSVHQPEHACPHHGKVRFDPPPTSFHQDVFVFVSPLRLTIVERPELIPFRPPPGNF